MPMPPASCCLTSNRTGRYERLPTDRHLIRIDSRLSLYQPGGTPVTLIDTRPFDADNHYYEPLDAFTRHLDPAWRVRTVEVAEIDGRIRHVVGGRVSRAVTNPTFNPIVKPGCLHGYF